MPLLGTTGRKESIMKDIYSVAERNRIVEEQLCCIDKVLHRYRNLLQAARLEHDDLYQDLAIRLILAVDSYHPEAGPLRPYLCDQLREELLAHRKIRRALCEQTLTWAPSVC